MSLLVAVLVAVAQAQDSPERALARKCDSQIPWITDGVELADGTPKAPENTAADRMELLDRAKKLAREKNRLILWYCMRVPGSHMYRAAVLDGYARVVFFTHPDVVDLVNAKFVPIRMACDEKLSASIGLKKPEFIEPGFVLLTPEGRIVQTIDRIRTFNADWLRAALVAVLRRNESANAATGDSVEDLIRGGDDEKALDRATADQKAAIYRHGGKNREVLGLPCAPVQKGLALLAMEDLDGARKIFEGDESAQALYHRAATETLMGKDPEKTLRTLVEKHPESPWAWRGAANLVTARDGFREGPMTHLFEDFSLPPPAEPVSTTRQPVEDVDRASRRAVEFLLRAQREDGSWSDARYSYGWAAYMIRRRISQGLLDPSYTSWPDLTLHPNLFVAITSIAAWALAERRDLAPERIVRALAKAEAYILDDAHLAPGRCEECFAETFRLRYFVERKDASRMNYLVGRLAKLQDADGFWGHEYPSAFATAAVVHTLVLAKRAGADVPEALLKRAADALQKTRHEDGRQDYRHEPGKPPSSEKNSMGRTAPSELALFECGRGPLENVAGGLEAYWKHRAKLEAIRTCDNHADEELAGFFYYYAVFHTVEAARALEGPDRAGQLRKFREQILSLPEGDGSFVDSHELGKSYGTAMGLLILNRVR